MKEDLRLLGLPPRLAIALGGGLLLVCAIYGSLWRDAPLLLGDSDQYLEVARDLADLRLDSLHDRPPAYPLLLVATGSVERPTRALFYVSMVFHVVSLWLLLVALDTLGVSRPLLLAFTGILLLPPYMERTGYVLTESLSELTLAAALAGIVLWYVGRGVGWLVLASLAVGFAALVRPTYQALAPAIAVTLLFFAGVGRCDVKRIARACAAIVILGSGIVLGYCAFNAERFGFFGITPLIGFNLSSRTVTVIERLPDSYGAVREELIRARDKSLIKPGGSHTGLQYIFSVRPRLAEITGLSPVELSRYMVRLNLLLIRSAPATYFVQVSHAVGSYWNASTTSLATFGSRPLQLLWMLLHFAVLTLAGLQLVMVAGPSILRLWAERGPRRLDRWSAMFAIPAPAGLAYLLSTMVIAYTMVISCAVDVGDPRHRTPTDPLIVFTMVLGMEICRRWVRLDRTIAAHTDGELS